MPSSPPRTSAPWRPTPVVRVRSWLGDWAVVGGWLALLAVLGALVGSLGDLEASGSVPTTVELLRADLLITLLTVVPYVVYLAVSETSPRAATVGKRWAGLEVADADGRRASAGAVWLRNVVKALPWQLAHLGVSRAVYEVQTPVAPGLVVLSLLLVGACAAPALVGGRGLHDVLAGTRVQRAARGTP